MLYPLLNDFVSSYEEQIRRQDAGKSEKCRMSRNMPAKSCSLFHARVRYDPMMRVSENETSTKIAASQIIFD